MCGSSKEDLQQLSKKGSGSNDDTVSDACSNKKSEDIQVVETVKLIDEAYRHAWTINMMSKEEVS